MDGNNPKTRRRSRARVGRRDLDAKRRCDRCGVQGLRYGNKTGLCNECRGSQPGLVKAAGTTDLPTIVGRLVRGVVAWYGEARAHEALGIGRELVEAALAGQCIIGEVQAANDDVEIDPGTIEPRIIALMMQRYWDLRPLDSAWSAVVGPWRAAMRAEVADECVGVRRRRVIEADERRRVNRYVPHLDAPLDHGVIPNGYGRTAPGAPRSDVPMRIAVALWALGFGAVRIVRIARRMGVKTSPSAIGRALKQAQRRFDGAVAVECQRLAAELDTRPLAGGR